MSTFKYYIARFITVIVALQVLNMSVYSVGGEPYSASHHTFSDYNDIDCLIEYVGEVVLGYRNLIPETGGHHHHKSMQLHKHLDFKLYNQGFAISAFTVSFFNKNLTDHYRENYHYPFYKEINPPPPKA